MGNAGGEAGHGGLVPGGEPQLAAEAANLLLPEARLQKGRPGPSFPRRDHSRPELPQVVALRSVSDGCQAQSIRLLPQDLEELALAEIATPFIVLPIAGVLQLGGLHEPVTGAEEERQSAGFFFLAGGQGW